MRKFLSAVSLVLMLACLLTACGGPAPGSSGASSGSTPDSQAPSQGVRPTTPGSTAGETDPTAPPAMPGKVSIYTCDEALAQVYRELAQEYVLQKGVEVSVVTSGGKPCGEALPELLASQEAPTVFCMHSGADMLALEAYLYDLTGSVVVSQLSNPAFALKKDGRILAVSAHIQGYGLLYNKELLARAGFTRTDIRNFADLEVACLLIRQAGLGISAFPALDFSDPDHGGSTCLLTGAQQDPESLRAFLTLYLANDKSTTNSRQLFLSGKTVFYLGGTWDYEAVSSLGDNKLDILPAFDQNGSGLRCTTELAWGVNGQASSVDIRQTLDFLRWLVTEHQGAVPVDRLGLFSPYLQAKNYGNQLEKLLRGYIAEDPVSNGWGCCGLSDPKLTELHFALKAYAANPTNTLWAKVEESWT